MLKFNENSLQSDGFLVHHYEAIPSKCPPLARLLQSSTPCQFYKSWLASFPQPFKVSTFSLRALLPATLPGVVSLDVLSMACEQDAAVLWLLSLIYAPPYVDGAAESRRQKRFSSRCMPSFTSSSAACTRTKRHSRPILELSSARNHRSSSLNPPDYAV